MNSSSTSVAPFTGAIGWKVVLFWSSKRFFSGNWLKSGSVLILKRIFFRQKPEGLQVQWCLTLCVLDRTCYWRRGEGIRIRFNTCTFPVSAATGQWATSSLPEGTCGRHWRGFREGSNWGGPLVQPPGWTKKEKIRNQAKGKIHWCMFFCPPLLACSFLLSSSSLP